MPMMMLDADAAKTDVRVSTSAVLAEADVGAVLDDLDQRSSVQRAPSIANNRVDDGAPRGGAGNFLLALLVLIAAGGATAVVYFALPYFT